MQTHTGHGRERECRTEQTLLEHYNPPYLSSSLLLCFSVCLSLIMISQHQSAGRSKQGQSVYNAKCHTHYALRKFGLYRKICFYVGLSACVCVAAVFSQSNPPILRSQGHNLNKLGSKQACILCLIKGLWCEYCVQGQDGQEHENTHLTPLITFLFWRQSFVVFPCDISGKKNHNQAVNPANLVWFGESLKVQMIIINNMQILMTGLILSQILGQTWTNMRKPTPTHTHMHTLNQTPKHTHAHTDSKLFLSQTDQCWAIRLLQPHIQY